MYVFHAIVADGGAGDIDLDAGEAVEDSQVQVVQMCAEHGMPTGRTVGPIPRSWKL